MGNHPFLGLRWGGSKSRSRRGPGQASPMLRLQATFAFPVCVSSVSTPSIGGPTGSPSRARCRRGRGHHESALKYTLFPLRRSLLSADLPSRPPTPPRPATPPADLHPPVVFGSSLFGGACAPCQLCGPRSSRTLHFGKRSGTSLVVLVCHQPFPVPALSPPRASVRTHRWCSPAPTPSKALRTSNPA